MSFEYDLLVSRIKEIFGTQKAFAKAMQLSEHSLSRKIRGKVDWTQTEIKKACSLLGIIPSEIHLYFFTLIVQY